MYLQKKLHLVLYIDINYNRDIANGELAEWSNATVLKTVGPSGSRGFESLTLRTFKKKGMRSLCPEWVNPSLSAHFKKKGTRSLCPEGVNPRLASTSGFRESRRTSLSAHFKKLSS